MTSLPSHDSSAPIVVESWSIHGCFEGKITCDYDDDLADRTYIDGIDLAYAIGSRCEGLQVRIEISTVGDNGYPERYCSCPDCGEPAK